MGSVMVSYRCAAAGGFWETRAASHGRHIGSRRIDGLGIGPPVGTRSQLQTAALVLVLRRRSGASHCLAHASTLAWPGPTGADSAPAGASSVSSSQLSLIQPAGVARSGAGLPPRCCHVRWSTRVRPAPQGGYWRRTAGCGRAVGREAVRAGRHAQRAFAVALFRRGAVAAGLGAGVHQLPPCTRIGGRRPTPYRREEALRDGVKPKRTNHRSGRALHQVTLIPFQVRIRRTEVDLLSVPTRTCSQLNAEVRAVGATSASRQG